MWGGIIALGVILILLIIGAAVGLAFIPAYMAGKKGYSFGLFWLFGFFLLIPAIIVAAVIEHRAPTQNLQSAPQYAPPPPPVPAAYDNPPDAEQMKQIEKLVEQGFISENEYEERKKGSLGF